MRSGGCRDLGGGELQHRTQDQHRTLGGGQVLERGDERQLHALPLQGACGRVEVLGAGRRLQVLRPGLQPYRPGDRLTQVGRVVQRRAVLG